MGTFDEEIARRIQEAADSGELGQAKGYGKPLPDDPGWDSTPAELRMAMKILKDAGAAPPEVALFHDRARLRSSINTTADPGERQKLERQLAEIELQIALRLEMAQVGSKP
jgi:hypothetical protein